MPVYFRHVSGRTRFIILISDGGKYGLSDLTLAEYKGVPLVDYRFHRGTLTKQIEPLEVTMVDDSSNDLTVPGHTFVDDDAVRLAVSNGTFPSPLAANENGQTQIYYLHHVDGDNVRLSTTIGGGDSVDITSIGTGNLIIWKADAGFDDEEQGLPEYCPEFDSTFSNIAYVEGMLSAAHSHATNAPDWADFRFAGDGRRLMDYDDEGNELGVILGEDEEERKLLSLVPLHVADNYLVNYKGKHSRIDFESWREMRERAEVEIWQRIRTDETGTTHGLSARYYQGDDFTNFVLTRNELQVNIPTTGPTIPPAPGVTGYGFSVVWTGRIKFEYSEVYTLTFDTDNDIEVIIDGTTILSETTVAVHTVEFTVESDRVYDIEIRFRQLYDAGSGNNYRCIFKWQSDSQSIEVVPSDWFYPSDEVVLRYGQTGMAFPTPTEASEVHERLMERIVGYDWTDSNGKIVFLPPDRPTVFEFKFDRIDDDSVANFVYGSFQKRRRPLSDRKNFKIGRGRNALLTGYPVFYTQVDRDNLRKLTNGEPSNDAASELGVCTLSMADRMLEMEMKLKSDPTHTFSISGVRGSSIIRKNQFITVFYYDLDGNYVADTKAIVTSHTWGARNSRNDFAALPIGEVFYTDEEV